MSLLQISVAMLATTQLLQAWMIHRLWQVIRK